MTLVLPLLLWLGAVLAGDLPEVAVVGLHVPALDDTAATEASAGLARAIDDTGRLDALSTAEVEARLQGREDLVLSTAFLGRGLSLLEKGRLLYERAEPDQAVPVLEEAAARLSEELAWTTDGRPLAEALLLAGCARLVAGDEAAARSAFARVVSLDPGRELDPVNFAPRLVDLYAAVRQEVLTAGLGSLEITTDDPGAGVWVDGRRVGVTPVAVEGLPVGSHQVLVVGAGGYRRSGLVNVRGGERTDAHVALRRATLGVPAHDARERSAQTERLYRALGEHLEVDAILLGGLDEQGAVALQLYTPRSRTFSRPVSARTDGDPTSVAAGLVPALADALSTTGTLRGDRASSQVLALDLSANPVLAGILLDLAPAGSVASRVPVPTPGARPARWVLWTGAGLLGAGVLAAGAWWVASTVGGDDGTISVGPIP